MFRVSNFTPSFRPWKWQHYLWDTRSRDWYDVMAAILKGVVKSKIRLRQPMNLYVRNTPANVHCDPIWNHGTLGILKRSPQ